MSDRMTQMALAQPGFLGAEATRDDAGLGITVSYWTDAASIEAWKAVAENLVAQRLGQTRWYSHCEMRIVQFDISDHPAMNLFALGDADGSPILLRPGKRRPQI